MTITFTEATRDDTRKALTFARVRALFDYDDGRGVLIWRTRPVEEFVEDRACRSWNTRFAGKIAGAVNKRGYREIRIDYELYLAHRLIWFWHHGEWPAEIDHEHGVGKGDRIGNLRHVDQAANMRNLSRRKDNKSGVTGVRWNPMGRNWIAEIRVSGRTVYLGRFSTIEAATGCRKAAEREHGFHRNHGRPAA